MRTNGTLNYLIGDHLGSTSLTTDAAGNLLSQMKYKAWGETRYSSGPLPTKYQYTGQFSYAADFGLLYYNARWVDPSLGRFVQADTIVPGGVQGLDRYAYVNNSPMNYVDPSGHMCSDPDDLWSSGCDGADTVGQVSHGGGLGNFGGGNSGNGSGSRDGGGNLIPDLGLNNDNANGNTGPITDAILNLPFSDDFYTGAATFLDSAAWLTDLYAVGIVTYGGIYGAGLGMPGTVVGGPAVPTVTGLAGMVIAEFYAQPVLTIGNGFATLSTISTVIADTKTGNTRIEDGVFSSNVRNSFTLTAAGWANKEAYLSLAIQSVALTNDFGWTSLPFQTNPQRR